MANITVQTMPVAGLAATYQAATASDTIVAAPGDERLFLHAKNTNAAAATITITPQSPQAFKVPKIGLVTLQPLVITVPATTGDRMIPIPPGYIDASGSVTLANTGTISNLTLAAVWLQAPSA